MSEIDFEKLSADQLRDLAQQYRLRDNKPLITSPIIGLYETVAVSPLPLISPTGQVIKFRGVVVETDQIIEATF